MPIDIWKKLATVNLNRTIAERHYSPVDIPRVICTSKCIHQQSLQNECPHVSVANLSAGQTVTQTKHTPPRWLFVPGTCSGVGLTFELINKLEALVRYFVTISCDAQLCACSNTLARDGVTWRLLLNTSTLSFRSRSTSSTRKQSYTAYSGSLLFCSGSTSLSTSPPHGWML